MNIRGNIYARRLSGIHSSCEMQVLVPFVRSVFVHFCETKRRGGQVPHHPLFQLEACNLARRLRQRSMRLTRIKVMDGSKETCLKRLSTEELAKYGSRSNDGTEFGVMLVRGLFTPLK